MTGASGNVTLDELLLRAAALSASKRNGRSGEQLKQQLRMAKCSHSALGQWWGAAMGVVNDGWRRLVPSDWLASHYVQVNEAEFPCFGFEFFCFIRHELVSFRINRNKNPKNQNEVFSK